MVYVDIQDFLNKAAECKRLSREEEISCALSMKAGDPDARERLVQSYLPVIAGHMKRLPEHLRTLTHGLYCVAELEMAVDRFDFEQAGEPFLHRIGRILRQASAKYLTRNS